jgi:hypothetical protein
MGHEQISTTLNQYTDDARDYADLRAAVFASLVAEDLLTSEGPDVRWQSKRAGGDGGTRTPNPRLAKAVLCQLSYVP